MHSIRMAKGWLRTLKRSLDRADYVWLGSFALLAILILWFHSSELPMQIFDESRNANNALELARSHHWLVPTYAGNPDHWNTKPPLLIWVIVALMRLGLEPFAAVRLPTLLITVATTTLLYYFFRKQFDARTGAIAAALLLLGSYTWMGIHGARTGDYDTLQGFFILSYVLAFWKSTEHRRLEFRWILLCGLCVFLAVMTKGIAGVLALPGLALFTVLTRRSKLLLENPRFWIAATGSALLCLGYYLSREWYDPGYLHAVAMNELAGRYLQVNEGHAEGRFYYLFILLQRFTLGILALPFALLFIRSRRYGSLIAMNLLCAGCLLLILSTSQTKLRWYAVPLVPLLSVAGATGLQAFVNSRTDARRRHLAKRMILAVLLLGCLECWFVTERVLKQMLVPAGTNPQTMYGQFLSAIVKAGEPRDILAFDNGVRASANFQGYSPVLDFYRRLASDRGINVSTSQTEGRVVAPGAWVMTCDPHAREWLLSNYDGTISRENPSCMLEQINGERARHRTGELMSATGAEER